MGSGENSSRRLPATAFRPVVTIWRSSYTQNSESPSRTMWGAFSRHASGTRSCHSRAGSMRWSSTEMNQLKDIEPSHASCKESERSHSMVVQNDTAPPPRTGKDLVPVALSHDDEGAGPDQVNAMPDRFLCLTHV